MAAAAITAITASGAWRRQTSGTVTTSANATQAAVLPPGPDEGRLEQRPEREHPGDQQVRAQRASGRAREL